MASTQLQAKYTQLPDRYTQHSETLIWRIHELRDVIAYAGV